MASTELSSTRDRLLELARHCDQLAEGLEQHVAA